jgi:hypothetical protein
MSAFKYNRLDKNNAAVLMVDHQTGLTNLVQDFSPDDFKNNVLAKAFESEGQGRAAILRRTFSVERSAIRFNVGLAVARPSVLPARNL